MGFHLKPKNTLLPVEPGGDENVIGIRAFNFVVWHPVERDYPRISFMNKKFVYSVFQTTITPGGGSQIWNRYGCKGRAQTGWGIQWEHRLKKWGVIGWEHDFWHSVREKYKNMWGHRVRAKISQKITWTWLVFSMLDCKITKVNFFTCQLFKSWGFEWQIKCKNMGLWVWAHATVKKYGVYGCQRCWKRGSFDPYIHVASRMGLPPPPPGTITW